MKNNTCIYLIPSSPVFNKEAVPLFEIMDKEHSSILYSALYLNNFEVLDKIKVQHNLVICICREDENNIPPELDSAAVNKTFCDTSNFASMYKQLNEKYFSKYARNLVIFSRSIAYNESIIQKIFELLSVEDDAVVIGKAQNDSLSFLGFTKFHEEIFRDPDKTDFNYDNYLSVVCKHNYFVSVLEKTMFIRDWNDFKLLYAELSKKESLNYCSQKMHEAFTHLFIEYKEQMK